MEETGTVSVAGGELFYRVAGEGPKLLLVHGVGPDSRGWTPTFEKLAEDHRVVAYDRRGYGRSSPPPSGGGWRSHGEDAAALVEELELSPASVVGWSGGGTWASAGFASRPMRWSECFRTPASRRSPAPTTP